MWSGPLSEGKVAVTIFNRGDTTAKITAFGNALSLVPNRRAEYVYTNEYIIIHIFGGLEGGSPPISNSSPPPDQKHTRR